jgi:hypothetical protein
MTQRSLLAAALGAVAVLSVAAPLAAQPHRYFSSLQYSVAQPIGDTHDFIPDFSWSGAAWESRWMDRPHTSLGFLVGFNEFHRSKFGTENFEHGAITGDQYRYVLAAPLLFTAAWYFDTDRNNPRWYVGGGAGVEYVQQKFQIGLFDERRTNWRMVMMPEVGWMFPAWFGTGGIIALRYHLPASTPGLFNTGHQRFQFVSLSVGLGYR